MQQFRSKFSLDTGGASELLGSAAHLLGSPQILDTQLNGLVDKNHKRFTPEQAESMIEMVSDVAAADGPLSTRQTEFIDSLRARLIPPKDNQGTW